MSPARLRRSLLGSMLVLVCLLAFALRPTATWSAALSPEISGEAEAMAPQLASGNWYGWQNLGNLNGSSVRDPVIGQNKDGHLEILAWAVYGPGALDYAVYRRNQIGVNGSNWTAWTSLGTLQPGTSYPVVATNPAGRMEAFAAAVIPTIPGSPCTTDVEIKQIWQTAPNNGWSNWTDMGLPLPFICDPLYLPNIAMNADGRLDLFALAKDTNLYHRWQTSPNGAWSAGWNSLGHPSGVNLSTKQAIGRNADGRLAIFASGNTEIYHIWQNTPGNETSWSAWTGFGKPSSSVTFGPFAPTLGQNQDGRLQIFSDGSDGLLWCKSQVAPNSFWTNSWASLGKPPTVDWISGPHASQTRDGRVVVFVTAKDGAIWYIAQTQPNGMFGGWTSLGKPAGVIFQQLTIGENQNGTLVIAAVDNSGKLWLNSERIQLFLPFVLR